VANWLGPGARFRLLAPNPIQLRASKGFEVGVRHPPGRRHAHLARAVHAQVGVLDGFAGDLDGEFVDLELFINQVLYI